MLADIIIIVVGLLIAVYPPLLSLGVGVAAFLILACTVLVVHTGHTRKLLRTHPHPMIPFIFRY